MPNDLYSRESTFASALANEKFASLNEKFASAFPNGKFAFALAEGKYERTA